MVSLFLCVFPVYATSETVTPLTEDVHGSAAMVETMTTLLQAQAEAMAAHPRATAAQQLPALPLYTGKETGKQMTALSVLKWKMITMFNRKLLDKTDCLTPLHNMRGVTMYPLSPPQNPTYSAIWTT